MKLCNISITLLVIVTTSVQHNMVYGGVSLAVLDRISRLKLPPSQLCELQDNYYVMLNVVSWGLHDICISKDTKMILLSVCHQLECPYWLDEGGSGANPFSSARTAWVLQLFELITYNGGAPAGRFGHRDN